MSEPEIARRCSFCGASIRVRAFFCPQCGKEVRRKSDSSPLNPTGDLGIEWQKGESLADTVDLSPGRQSGIENAPTVPIHNAVPSQLTEPLRQPPDQGQPSAVGSNEIRGERHGVEKWMYISTAVLDEASYDPSLRFVLVAAVLFFLFLLMVIVSELIT